MGQGYWSRSDCRPDVWWFWGSDGFWYWLDGYSETHGARLVWGAFVDVYRNNGWECGWLGAPLSHRYRNGGWEIQDFQGGYIAWRFA